MRRCHFFCCLRLIACVALLWSLGATALGQVECERVYPASVTYGEQLVTVEGKFATWPIGTYCDRADVQVECAEEKGKLRVIVAADSPPGVTWLRLFDSRSASGLLPVLLEPHGTHNEEEPNGSVEEAALLDLPVTINGRLEKNEDVDGFRIQLASGQTLVASVIANQILGSPMDAVLQVVDMRGNVLAQNDDERGIDPQLTFKSERDQEIVVRLFAFPETPNSTIGLSGGPAFVYCLRLTTGPFLDHVLPLVKLSGQADENAELRGYGWNLEEESVAQFSAAQVSPTIAYQSQSMGWQWLAVPPRSGRHYFDSPPTSSEVTLPAIFSGHIDRLHEEDHFTFLVRKDLKYRAEVVSREFGFHLDSVLSIRDPATGEEIARNDDVQRRDYDAAVEFTAKQDGKLMLAIRDISAMWGPRLAYSIQLQEVEPGVALRLTSGALQLEAGKQSELKVEIQRNDGYDRALTLSAIDLPTGVTCQAVRSEAGGKSANEITLILEVAADAGEFNGQVRWQATEDASDGAVDPSVHPVFFELRPGIMVDHVWLTVAATAEKQTTEK